jgi:hypothetical protein
MTIGRVLRARWLRWSALATLASFALIGFAHTPAGRPLLNALRGAPGCPVDLSQGDPAVLEAHRIAALELRRGEQREASSPALGFELGRTHKADVLARMKAGGVSCEAMRGGSALRCTALPASFSTGGAPAIDDLHAQFDASDRLVAIDLFRAGSSSDHALRWLGTLSRELGTQVGQPTASRGARTATELNQYLGRAVVEYRYRGYVAQLSAFNVGKRGVLVREQYQWLPAPAPHAG